MKRKAPQTLLEFSEYILPLKRIKLHPQPENAPQLTLYYEKSHYDLGCAHTYLNAVSVGKEDSDGADPVCSTTSIAQDLFIDAICNADLLAKKPKSNKKPIDTFVEAIKWLIQSQELIQREVARELGVSPSTLSLYLNKVTRNHGWREFEVKVDTWLRTKLRSPSN